MTRAIRVITVRPVLSVFIMGIISGTPLGAQIVTPAEGGKLFGQQCGVCHSAVPGEVRVGPSLAGVVGRKAGSAAGYSYSAALAKSGLTWNAANLDTWLTNTQADLPGTKMGYAQADPAKRRAIIAYLASLSK